MHRIKITNDQKKEVAGFSKGLFSKRQFKHPKEALQDLCKKRGYRTGKKNAYINNIVKEYDNLLKATPAEFEDLIASFEKILPHTHFRKNFAETIVKTLRYSDLRDREYLEYFHKKGHRSCFYCNAQFSMSMGVEFCKGRKRKGEIKGYHANFELDHYKPKSKYPFLATSFYNLIPSCSSCNKMKSKLDLPICMYTEGDEHDLFTFYITPKSQQEYWRTKNIKDIVICFIPNSTFAPEELEKYESMFKLKALYAEHRDIVEELLHKKSAYSNSYKYSLRKDITNLFPDEALINRLLIGTYTKPDEILKRPLSKLTQDIARQLKLI